MKKKSSFQIILATRNMHKIREFKYMFQTSFPCDILSLYQFPKYTDQEENGTTFKENAILKASSAAKALNKWALADDSGLVVPSLNGQPGIFSSRFAGPNASDKENRQKLLDKMDNLTGNDRFAYYECCIVLSSPSGVKVSVSSSCEGYIISQERGGGGFGYDPIFIKHEYNKTFSELGEDIKNQISHRAKAFEKILMHLQSLTHEEICL